MPIIHKFTNLDTLYNNDKFILSALNLAFIGYFSKNKIKLNENFYLWPDGITAKLFGFKEKIPGRKLIGNIKLNLENIENVVLLGNSSNNINNFLEYKFKKKIINVNLPISDTSELIQKLPKIIKENLYIVTLPTPKQEIIAAHISKNNKFFKVICIGGGLEIASGDIEPCPAIFEKLGLESLWRLRTDFIRRLIRLGETFIFFCIFWFSKKKKELIFKSF